MIFEQEAWQTARIFENDLWKGFKKIPSYDQFEIRLSTFGLSNNDGKISGAVYVRKIGFDIVQKIEFWSHSSYTVVK
jgi:hypothetical protein